MEHSYRYPLNLIRDLPISFPGFTRYINLAGILTNISRIRRVSCAIAQQINNTGYDWVFVHHERIVQSPSILNYLAVPSVYFCNEPMRQFYEPEIVRPYHTPKNMVSRLQDAWYTPERKLRYRLIKAWDQRNIARTTLLLTNSFFSAENIYRAYGLRARVVYLGVDNQRFAPQSLEKENYAVSVGAVNPLKGYDFIIQALGHVPACQRPSLRIIGNTASQAEVNYLNALARQCAVSVQFIVNCSEEELVKLYNQARLFLYAPVLEPFGLAPLEAMSCGLPIVAVAEGGVRESVQSGVVGILTERDPKLFANAVQSVLCNQDLARRFAANGPEIVKSHWTWEHAYRRLVDTINASLVKANS